MANAVASTLSPTEAAEVEALLGLGGGIGGPSNLPNGRAPVASNAKIIITYDEMVEFRKQDIPLDGMYVRMTNDEVTGLVPASKTQRWLTTGYHPA